MSTSDTKRIAPNTGPSLDHQASVMLGRAAAALRAYAGNVHAAARALGVSPDSLKQGLKKRPR